MQYPSLTEKQQDLFDRIVEQVKMHDRWPTMQELMDGLGLSSPNSISQLYKSLIDKHYTTGASLQLVPVNEG